MDNYNSLLLWALFSLIAVSGAAPIHAQERQVYELKTYTLENGTQEQLVDHYLKEAYLPALKRSGIGPVGVFKVRPGEEGKSDLTILVLTPFTSLEQFRELEQRLLADTTYLQQGKKYLEAPHDTPPYLRISTTLLRAFKDMPQLRATVLEGERKDRVYELRSYESATEALYRNKVKMFNEGGEVTLFDKLGFNAVFYGEVLSGNSMPNLMYMTTFKDQESRDAHWKSFSDAPEWKTLSALPEYQNNVSHIDILFLYPTDYSDY
jgi:hypothetical protein